MPEKAALQTPLTPALWYARPAFSETFRLGPFPSLEDALVEVREELPLPAGAVVEFGQLTPWVPDAGARCILESLGIEACGPENGSVGSAWSATLDAIVDRDNGAAVAELNAALNLVLWGWMTKHECHPNFGTVGNVLIYRVNEAKALEPAPQPPGMAPPVAAEQPPAETATCRNCLRWIRRGPDGWHHTMGHLERMCSNPEPQYVPEVPALEPPENPPAKWERCPHTGQNLMTHRDTRCCLRAGHGGPHQMEELPVPEVRLRDGRRRCTFIRPTDGKRCNIFSMSIDPGHTEHAFTCGKLIESSPGSTCDLVEGHDGPCNEIPF